MRFVWYRFGSDELGVIEVDLSFSIKDCSVSNGSSVESFRSRTGSLDPTGSPTPLSTGSRGFSSYTGCGYKCISGPLKFWSDPLCWAAANVAASINEFGLSLPVKLPSECALWWFVMSIDCGRRGMYGSAGGGGSDSRGRSRRSIFDGFDVTWLCDPLCGTGPLRRRFTELEVIEFWFTEFELWSRGSRAS